MRQAKLNYYTLDFELTPRKSRRHTDTDITDLNYADNIVLISDIIEKKAQ